MGQELLAGSRGAFCSMGRSVRTWLLIERQLFALLTKAATRRKSSRFLPGNCQPGPGARGDIAGKQSRACAQFPGA